jgi:hypothetical protein
MSSDEEARRRRRGVARARGRPRVSIRAPSVYACIHSFSDIRCILYKILSYMYSESTPTRPTEPFSEFQYVLSSHIDLSVYHDRHSSTQPRRERAARARASSRRVASASSSKPRRAERRLARPLSSPIASRASRRRLARARWTGASPRFQTRELELELKTTRRDATTPSARETRAVSRALSLASHHVHRDRDDAAR